MREAIDEAELSVAEDDAARPKVGALLVDEMTGEILVRAHRGETTGAHAEYTLFSKAVAAGISTHGRVLFTTLEPCVQRGVAKVPCVERVAAAGLSAVFIGTLDPNPYITGRGEMQLSYGDQHVGRFPLSFQRALRETNSEFFEEFRTDHVVTPLQMESLLPSRHVVAAARKGSDRNRLLQSTLDLISATTGDVDIWAGDLSWFREAFVPILYAARSGRKFRILTTPPLDSSDQDEGRYWEAVSAASAVGEVRRTPTRAPVKMTLGRTDDRRFAILIDRGSASLLSDFDDTGSLDIFSQRFEQEWSNSNASDSTSKPVVVPVDSDKLTAALRSVAQYRSAGISVQEIDPASTLPMTRNLERFKLARLRELTKLVDVPGFELGAKVTGSPWSITPPVVEKTSDGDVVVMDGTHRMYDAIGRGATSMSVMVVEGVDSPLPALPVASWDDVRVHLVKLPRAERYVNYRSEHFRLIRYAFSRL